jgi:hypothetical protein
MKCYLDTEQNIYINPHGIVFTKLSHTNTQNLPFWEGTTLNIKETQIKFQIFWSFSGNHRLDLRESTYIKTPIALRGREFVLLLFLLLCR